MTDDLGGKTMMMIEGYGGVHRGSMAQERFDYYIFRRFT
jgi:hypothetical protein